MQRVFTALFLCLAILLGIAANASGAFTQPRLETCAEVFESPAEADAWQIEPLSLDLPQATTMWGYDPATDVWFYVRQNPWTAFDPHGLSLLFLNPGLAVPRPVILPKTWNGPQLGPSVPTSVSPHISGGYHRVPKRDPQGAKWQPNPPRTETRDDGEKVLVIYDKYPKGSEQSSDMIGFAQLWNDQIKKAGHIDSSGRHALKTRDVSKSERATGDGYALLEKTKNPHVYPSGGSLSPGHLPDMIAGGAVHGPFIPVDQSVNRSIGSQVKQVHQNTGGYEYNKVEVRPWPKEAPKKPNPVIKFFHQLLNPPPKEPRPGDRNFAYGEIRKGFYSCLS